VIFIGDNQLIKIMNIKELYNQKLCSADEAVKVVNTGDLVEYGAFNGKPVQCDIALAKRGGELKDIHVYGVVTLPPVPEVAKNPFVFTYHDWHFSKVSRIMNQQYGIAHYSPIIYHMAPNYYRDGYRGTRRSITIFQVSPMDAKGYFNLGPNNSETLAKAEISEAVIVEINPNMPVALGGSENTIHISEVHAVVEAPAEQFLAAVPPSSSSSADEMIAKHVLEHIDDRFNVQLGIGGVPNAVGDMISKSGLKDLGGHTEMLSDAYVNMIESGVMTGRFKNIDKRKVSYTFAMGTQKLYDFINNNPALASQPVDYVNDPRVIAQLDNFISINNALQVDLFSQVNAESIGTNQVSGNGGMWDFVTGSQWSKNGKSFICLNSTFKDKEGNLQSRITSAFEENTIVTIPRQMVDYIVTEFGAVRLKTLPVYQRAEALISIAHPDFREDLIKKATEMKIWRKTNKITV
jgi:acyl-CoA hydrolase